MSERARAARLQAELDAARRRLGEAESAAAGVSDRQGALQETLDHAMSQVEAATAAREAAEVRAGCLLGEAALPACGAANM